MNKFKNMFNTTFSRIILTSAITIAAVLVVGLINEKPFIQADVNCELAPTVATLNPFPVTFSGEPCMDWPAIDARVESGQYSQNFADLSNGVEAQAGNEVHVVIYVHNGAAVNLDPDLTTARNVRVVTTIDQNSNGEHFIRTTFRGDNTKTTCKKCSKKS